MLIGDRIKTLRKEMLHLTLEEFGSKLGVTKVAISNIENGNRNLTEQMKLSICREFHIRNEWLETGEGDIFRTQPKNELEALAIRYNLDKKAMAILEQFVLLRPDQQQAVIEYVWNAAAALESLELEEDAEEESEADRRERLHAELDRQLDLEAGIQKSEVS